MSWTCRALLCLASLFVLAGPAGAEPPPEATANRTDCASAPGTDAESVATLDLNTADERALLELPGIGPARARAILAFRAAHGGFHSVSQLLQIKGIGRALLKQLRPLVTLSGGGPRALAP